MAQGVKVSKHPSISLSFALNKTVDNVLTIYLSLSELYSFFFFFFFHIGSGGKQIKGGYLLRYKSEYHFISKQFHSKLNLKKN